MDKHDLRELDIRRMDVYVDGSYAYRTKGLARAAVYLCYLPDGSYKTLISANLFTAEELKLYSNLIKMRQIGGEILSALDAICIANTINRDIILHIYYDYLGIEKWATGEWKSNKHYTKKYAEEIRNLNYPSLHFHKVPAHSGVFYNELADFLANLCSYRYPVEVFSRRLKSKLKSFGLGLTNESYTLSYKRWGRKWDTVLLEVDFVESLIITQET